jgi:hypothetical protein
VRLPLALAIIDASVAAVLLWRLPSQQHNKEAVLLVAALLLGIAGWLAVLGTTGRTEVPPPRPPSSPQPDPSGPIT